MDVLPQSALSNNVNLSTPQKLVRSRYKKTITTTEVVALPYDDSPTRGYESTASPNSDAEYDISVDETFALPGKHNRDSTASLEAARKKPKTDGLGYPDDGHHDDADIGKKKGSVGRRLAKPRKSRFIEGSMNNRASERPLPELIGMDDKMGEMGVMARGDNGNVGQGVAGERKEEFTVGGLVSSVFTFRAKSYCKETWWNPRKAKFEEMEKKRKDKEEQKKRAEEKYMEMKKKGTLFTHATSMRSDDKMDLDVKESQIGRAVSTDEIVPAGTFTPTESTTFSPGVHSNPSYTDGSDPEYIPSAGKSTRRLSKQPKDASSTLKKRASRLFSPKRDSTISTTPAVITPVTNGTVSKRELQKQQKLIKKYSDLEDKLTKARRELAEAGIAPPPIPPLPQDLVNRLSVSKVPVTSPPLSDKSTSNINISMTENDKPSPLVNGKPISAPMPTENNPFQSPLSSNPSVNIVAPPTPGQRDSSMRSRHGSTRSRKGSLRGRHVRSISMGSSRNGSPPPPVRESGQTPEVPTLSTEMEL